MKAQETLNNTRFEVEEIAKDIKDKEYRVVLGKGLAEPIAKEAALKIKEITYMHSEGYSSGEFKHGPLALIKDYKSCVGIFYVLNDENFDFNLFLCDNIMQRKHIWLQLLTARKKFLKVIQTPLSRSQAEQTWLNCWEWYLFIFWFFLRIRV